MKPTNTLAPQNKKKVAFSAAITGDSLQNLIKKSVASPEAAARLTGTLISAVAASPQLQECNPATVVAAALRGEGMGLTLGREYHLIPFREKCAYVIGYKGLIALCLAGNDVQDMDCIEVRDGELIGRDKRTKRPRFDFSIYATDEEAAKHPVIGYYAYVEFLSGRFRFEYMSIPEILEHAARYSKAFDIKKFQKMQNGELPAQEVERLKSGSPYYSSPETMFKKTVIRKLLNSGYVRLANSAAVRDAIDYDSDDNLVPDLDFGNSAIETTGEVIDTLQEAAEPSESTEASAKGNNTTKVEKPAPAKRGRPKKVDKPAEQEEAVEVEVVTVDDDDYESSFFGE